MRHKKAGRKYSRTREHRIAMFRNLLMNLIRYSRIQTTEAKAKGLKRIADRVVSLARTNSLVNIRKVEYFVSDKELIKKLFTEIGPKFANKKGGYTRIYKVGVRKGDAAPLAIIEFAFEEQKKAPKKTSKKSIKKPKKEEEKTNEIAKAKADKGSEEEKREGI